jgi:dihydropteroate synthase
MPMLFQCGPRTLDLSTVKVMGVLNVTPDSFSDGGQLYLKNSLNYSMVLKRAEQMLSEGAAIIDIGGESTRPGSAPVPIDEELNRVIPVVELIARELDVVISVDTSSPEVMLEAAKVGAGILNDVRALTRDGALAAAASTGLPVCLMHMQGMPQTMQDRPEYDDVVSEVANYLLQRVSQCEQAGIARRNIWLDPGFGFGKTDIHNLQLLQQLPHLVELGLPVLAGLSRKSLLGRLLGRDVNERLAGSLALALLAAQGGAKILRVHDVAATIDVLKVQMATASA